MGVARAAGSWESHDIDALSVGYCPHFITVVYVYIYIYIHVDTKAPN